MNLASGRVGRRWGRLGWIFGVVGTGIVSLTQRNWRWFFFFRHIGPVTSPAIGGSGGVVCWKWRMRFMINLDDNDTNKRHLDGKQVWSARILIWFTKQSHSSPTHDVAFEDGPLACPALVTLVLCFIFLSPPVQCILSAKLEYYRIRTVRYGKNLIQEIN